MKRFVTSCMKRTIIKTFSKWIKILCYIVKFSFKLTTSMLMDKFRFYFGIIANKLMTNDLYINEAGS